MFWYKGECLSTAQPSPRDFGRSDVQTNKQTPDTHAKPNVESIQIKPFQTTAGRQSKTDPNSTQRMTDARSMETTCTGVFRNIPSVALDIFAKWCPLPHLQLRGELLVCDGSCLLERGFVFSGSMCVFKPLMAQTVFLFSWSAAVELPTHTWDDATSGKSVFVQFFAPRCGYGQKLKPHWNRLMAAPGDHETSLIAEVDCTNPDSKMLCERNRVRGVPTLKWSEAGDLNQYMGPRTFKALSSFAENNLTAVCSTRIEEFLLFKHAHTFFTSLCI